VLESRDGRRVAVTGLGVLAPGGIGTAQFWAGLHREPAPERVRSVAGLDPGSFGLSHQEARRLDRYALLAVAAVTQALDDAALPDGDPDRRGVVLGTGIGGAHTWERQVAVLGERGERAVSPLTVPMVMPNAAAAAVSMRWNLRGPVETITTACASGTHAVAAGAKLIASGRCESVLVGGSESCATATNLAAFSAMRALSPSGVSRPFDVDRDGFCSAEAGAALVLEELSAARARGARVYAEIAGSASTADAYHLTAPAPGGSGAARTMRLALDDAGIEPAQVAHINAHGTSTQLNDAAEAEAIAAVFGTGRPPVTSIKGVTGHSLGAAGAVEAVAVSLSYASRSLPPTACVSTVDLRIAESIDVVAEPRAWTPGPVLSNSFAFGGHNGSLVFLPA